MNPGAEGPQDVEFLCVFALRGAEAGKLDPAGCGGKRATLAMSRGRWYGEWWVGLEKYLLNECRN